jgi:hypothetical protein
MKSFTIFTLHHLLCIWWNKNGWDRRDTLTGRDEKCIQKCNRKPEVKRIFEDPGIDGTIILKWILYKFCMRVWSAIMLRSTHTGFHKRRKISWPTKSRSAFREGHCSLELVVYTASGFLLVVKLAGSARRHSSLSLTVKRSCRSTDNSAVIFRATLYCLGLYLDIK